MEDSMGAGEIYPGLDNSPTPHFVIFYNPYLTIQFSTLVFPPTVV